MIHYNSHWKTNQKLRLEISVFIQFINGSNNINVYTTPFIVKICNEIINMIKN